MTRIIPLLAFALLVGEGVAEAWQGVIARADSPRGRRWRVDHRGGWVKIFALSLAGLITLLFAADFGGLSAADAAQRRSTVAASHEGFRFGQCLARFNAEATETLLQTAPGTSQEDTAYRELVPRDDHRCVQLTSGDAPGLAQLHVPIPLLRGHLAQTRYLETFPDGPPPSIENSPPTEIDQQLLFDRLARAEDRPAEMVRLFSDCVVFARAIDVDALIRTSRSSTAEREALDDLSSAFGPCVWEGQSIQFDQDMLRASLADALYRKAQGWTETSRNLAGETH